MPRSDFDRLTLGTRLASDLGRARQKCLSVPYGELAYVSDGRHDGKGQNGDERHNDGNERHNDGKGQQGDGQHNDRDGQYGDGA